MLTELDNEISFNQKLFERIKYVYDNEYKKLKGEDQRLTEVIYKSFVRSGALLSAEKMERMKQINSRISDLQQKWDNLLPAATNNAVVWSSHCPDLIILDLGLPDMDGLDILRQLRSWSSLPVVVVSARAHEKDKVVLMM